MVEEKKFVMPKFNQVALVVKDLESTAAFLSDSLGIGPFQICDRNMPRTIYGKTSMAKRRVGNAKMGEVDLELIQPMEEGTPYYNFMHSRGEGLQHISFVPVEDLKETVAHFEEKGFKVVYGGEHTGGDLAGTLVAYMESEKAKGFIIEFVQRPKSGKP